jgi:branched-chain amino acid transport system substrate-binding protein
MNFGIWARTRYGLSLLIILVIGVACSGDREHARAEERLKVAALLPLTGPASHIGEWQRNGIDLALSELRQRGQTSIELKYEDTGGNPRGGLAAFLRVAADPQLDALLVSLSSVANAISARAIAAQLPTLLISVSYPGIAERSPLIFRNHPGSEDEASAMANFLEGHARVRRVAVLYINDDFGNGAREAFAEALRRSEAGQEVSFEDSYAPDQTDFRTLAARVRGMRAEAVYVIGYVDATALLLKQLREAGITQQLLCNMAMSAPNYIRLAGEALEGALFTVPTFVADPYSAGAGAREFVQAYSKRYGEAPTVFAALAHDSAMMVARAGEAKSTREAVLRNLVAIREAEGGVGSYSVDAAGNVKLPMVVVELRGGKLQVLESPKADGTR